MEMRFQKTRPLKRRLTIEIESQADLCANGVRPDARQDTVEKNEITKTPANVNVITVIGFIVSIASGCCHQNSVHSCIPYPLPSKRFISAANKVTG